MSKPSATHLNSHESSNIISNNLRVKIHECLKCGKSFESKSHLNRHTNSVHVHQTLKTEKKFACKECGKSFGFGQHLRRHSEVVHRGIKKYKCKYCQNTFSQGKCPFASWKL